MRVDAKLVEDERQLVHERDVEIALGVLDDLGRLGDLDRRGPEHARLHDPAIEPRNLLERFRIAPRDDLHDVRQGVLAVAGVDALR